MVEPIYSARGSWYVASPQIEIDGAQELRADAGPDPQSPSLDGLFSRVESTYAVGSRCQAVPVAGIFLAGLCGTTVQHQGTFLTLSVQATNEATCGVCT